MNYLGLNAIFLLALFLLAMPFFNKLPWRAIGFATVALLLITAIFDNVIIALGIVGYDVTKISGLLLGLAPIEDFAYTVVSVMAVAIIWTKVTRTTK